MIQRKNLKDSSILITGGLGFIGSHLAEILADFTNKKIIIIDNKFTGKEDNVKDFINEQYKYYIEDIESFSALEFIFKKHDIDIVFNLATKALNYSFINPSNAFSTNITSILNLLEFQRMNFFKTLCHFSTSEVYGTAIYEPMDETHPKNPTTTYAGGKAAADIAIETYTKMFKLDSFIVRPFNNFGEKQNFEDPLAGIIPKTARNILNGDKPEIQGDGNQKRDFIYVKDTVRACIELFEKIKTGDSVNIAAINCISIKDIIKKICDYYNYNGTIEFKPERKSDVKFHLGDNQKLKGLINFSFSNFDESLFKTLDWYKKEINGK